MQPSSPSLVQTAGISDLFAPAELRNRRRFSFLSAVVMPKSTLRPVAFSRRRALTWPGSLGLLKVWLKLGKWAPDLRPNLCAADLKLLGRLLEKSKTPAYTGMQLLRNSGVTSN